MTRIVSFVVLVAILLVIAGLFFQVMAGFLLPMFLAVLLVIIFGPLHRWIVTRCRGHDHLAAALTTAAILLIVLIPLALIVLKAASESYAIYEGIRESIQNELAVANTARHGAESQAAPANPHAAAAEPGNHDAMSLQTWAASKLDALGDRIGLQLDKDEIETTMIQKAGPWLEQLALSTPQYVGGTLIGLFVMIVSLYYFLVDGPAMVKTVMRLSPLEDKYEEQLIRQFADLTRAVVVATLLSAFVQGMLAGLGFLVAGLGSSVFLLMLLAMLFSMVPFIGAAAVWVPVCLWLFFFKSEPTTAIILAIYCATIVSMADNVIKPIVLHGRSNLHPLLALLSVLGGVQALGPIGIFVGPMVVAFLQTLLNMLHTELATIGDALPVKK